MDIFSHGLWAGAASVVAKRKQIPVKFRFAFLWGIFPDFFAFAPVFIYMIWSRFSGVQFSFPRPGVTELEPASASAEKLFAITPQLYELSHSLFIFTLVFTFAFLISKKKPWALGGWLIHILADIPTHDYKFYPTPFLWPFSNYRYDGFSWGQPWFLFIDFGLLAIIYSYFWLTRKKPNRPEAPPTS